eukprot:PhF_6_TR41663/c1_g1_i1/m.63161
MSTVNEPIHAADAQTPTPETTAAAPAPAQASAPAPVAPAPEKKEKAAEKAPEQPVAVVPMETEGKEPQVFKKFDVNTLQDTEFEDKNAWWSYLLGTFGSSYVLFNGVITLMGLAWGHLKTVSDQDMKTGAVMYIAVYGPLVFFFLYYLVFNNYYSEQVYYMYLKKGALISFPLSAKPGYWVGTPTPFLFVIFFLGYLGYILWLFGSTGAPFPTYYVFISNIVIQIFLYWMNHQSIENRFVTLSNYISSFKNKSGEREGIDSTNLTTATTVLNNSTLVDNKNASYTHALTTWYWINERKYGTFSIIMIRFLWLGIIAAVAAIALSFFQNDMLAANEKAWTDQINPCLDVCTRDPCTCIDLCKKAAKQAANDACQKAASAFYRNFTSCC